MNAAEQVKIANFRVKVMVEVAWSLTSMSVERVSLVECVCCIFKILYLLRFKIYGQVFQQQVKFNYGIRIIPVLHCLKLFQNYNYITLTVQYNVNFPYYTTGSAACNMGVEGIYLEDDRDTYYAGSVVMGPPSYKSRPSSMVYVNQGDYSNPVVIGNGDPSKYMFY